MNAHVPPSPSFLTVVVCVAAMLWMLGEIAAFFAGWDGAVPALGYPTLLLCLFGYHTWTSYRRWHNARAGVREPLAPC